MLATNSALTLGMHHSFFCHGLRAFFFRRWRTPSWDMEGVSPNSTTFPASRRTVQWSCPSGGGLQAKAIRWASPRSSNFRGRLAWGRSCKTLSNPSSAKRCLTRYTVLRATSKASATWGAAQPSSLFRRIRALAVTRAEFLPTRISRLELFPLFLCQPHRVFVP